EGGGLAGAVAAEQPGGGAAFERKGDAVDRARGLVDLHQLVDGNDGLDDLGHIGCRPARNRTCGAARRTRQGPSTATSWPDQARPAAVEQARRRRTLMP